MKIAAASVPGRPQGFNREGREGPNIFRGTAERYIKEGEHAVTWTRLTCCSMPANPVRLLGFRDDLRTHPAMAQAYAKEKLQARGRHPEDPRGDNDEKADWVKRIEAQVLAGQADRATRR